ncbi:hypothetical protein EDB85DRAFT_1888876 [Lactarius pseudohatsudake]|nr:hypothetical protein EDB85DRAFT_1888876 [Lactarius pseudohatsudake]
MYVATPEETDENKWAAWVRTPYRFVRSSTTQLPNYTAFWNKLDALFAKVYTRTFGALAAQSSWAALHQPGPKTKEFARHKPHLTRFAETEKWKKMSTTLVPMDRYLPISASLTRGCQEKVPRSVVVGGEEIPGPRVGVIVTQSVHTQARTAITDTIPNPFIYCGSVVEIQDAPNCAPVSVVADVYMSPLKGNYPVAASPDA